MLLVLSAGSCGLRKASAARRGVTRADPRRGGRDEGGDDEGVLDGRPVPRRCAAADEDTYFSCFAEGGVFLGTDAKERWTVPEFRAYAHPRFAGGKAWSFRSMRRDLSVRGGVAWFDEDLDTESLGPARGSGVLVRDATGEWKIVQYNLSIPIPNERFTDVRRVIGGR